MKSVDPSARSASTHDTAQVRQKNVRLGLILATIVLVFFVGFVGRIVLLGG